LFGKRIIIPQLMQWFIDNGGAKKFSHIVIKSGDFSGRSRSYVSTDGNWHLTHQYYGGGSSVPDMIQAQRLLHDRPDSIPLIEYAPSKVIDNIVKGDMMQDEQIERLIDLRITGHIEVLCHVQLGEEVWNKEKIPKASLCCGNVNKGFKIQKENRVKGEDGGWKVEKYNDILSNIENMVNVAMADSDDEGEETSSLIPNDDEEWLPISIIQIIPSALTPQAMKLYLRVKDCILTNYETNVWISRNSIVCILTGENEKKKNPLRARLSEMSDTNTKNAKNANNETSVGMLTKKENNEIFFRINK